MSSQYQWQGTPAENCIDGDLYTVCSTAPSKNTWLSVQLDATAATVTGVEVYNPLYATSRTPAELATIWYRLRDFEVWVGSFSGAWGEESNATLCVAATAPPTAGPFVHACDTATGPHVGEFVTIRLPGGYRYLSLGEVRVMV